MEVAAMKKPWEVYKKWEDPEPALEAFRKVKEGEWDFERFGNWYEHVKAVEARDTAMQFDGGN
jgi:hypothetical protein